MVCHEFDRSTVLSGVDLDVCVRTEREFCGLFADEGVRVVDMVRGVLRNGERSGIIEDRVDERAALIYKSSFQESC